MNVWEQILQDTTVTPIDDVHEINWKIWRECCKADLAHSINWRTVRGGEIHSGPVHFVLGKMRQQGTIHEYMCCLIASHITVDDVRVDMLALKIEWQIQDRVALIDPDRNPRIAVKKRAGHSVVLPVDAMVPDCADMQPREAALTIGVHES